jgi:hypothetical protein
MRLWGALLSVPVLSGLLFVAGCGDKSEKPVSGGGGGGAKSSGDKSSERASSSGGEKVALESHGTATLKGKVSFAGAQIPERKDLTPEMDKQADKDHCKKGDTKDQEWIVGADKGVANVIVWLRPPEGKYFKIPDEQRHRTDTVTMDQPFCAFIPHVQAINPSSWDPQTKKQVKTGQVFKIMNSAPINHNTAWSGNKLLNSGKNEIIPGKKGDKVNSMTIEAKPCGETAVGGEELLSVNCDIHKWMNAYVGVFDHPYYAVTDEHGNYEIKNAPADAEVVVAHWHQSFDPKSLRKAKTEKMKLQAGENTKNFEIQ